MIELQCEYCEKNFSTKSNLRNHQMKATYCLIQREKDNSDFKCSFCDKILASKFRLENHYKICKHKIISEYEEKYNDVVQKNKDQENIIFKYEEKFQNLELRINDYKNEIKDLQKQMKEITEKAIQKAIDKPTYDQRTTSNSNNKTIDNRTLNMIPMNLTQESLLKALEDKFTENHLMQGQKGLADFFVENVLVSPDGKYLMKCTDPSRKTFIYIDNEGNIQKDVNADKFTRMINGPVKKVSKKIYDGIYDRYTNNYNTDDEVELEDKETDEDRINFATDKLVELTSLKSDNSEFVKRLVSPLTN